MCSESSILSAIRLSDSVFVGNLVERQTGSFLIVAINIVDVHAGIFWYLVANVRFEVFNIKIANPG